jgi:hypothetical protein
MCVYRHLYMRWISVPCCCIIVCMAALLCIKSLSSSSIAHDFDEIQRQSTLDCRYLTLLNYVTIWKSEWSSKTFFPDTILGICYVFSVIHILQPNKFISVRKKSFGGTFTFSKCHIIGLDTGSLVLIAFVDDIIFMDFKKSKQALRWLPHYWSMKLGL